MFFRISIAACLLATCPAFCQKSLRNAAPVLTTTYIDANNGVSFGYPAVWKIENGEKFYLAPRILQSGLSPQVQVVFSPKGSIYEKTNLTGLIFVYARSTRPSESACDKLAMDGEPQRSATLMIHGEKFHHFDSSDAGMCHDVEQHVYWTYRAGTCYLFEGDMQTTCPGVEEGHRTITATEKHALWRHLTSIPATIRFIKPE